MSKVNVLNNFSLNPNFHPIAFDFPFGRSIKSFLLKPENLNFDSTTSPLATSGVALKMEKKYGTLAPAWYLTTETGIFSTSYDKNHGARYYRKQTEKNIDKHFFETPYKLTKGKHKFYLIFNPNQTNALHEVLADVGHRDNKMLSAKMGLGDKIIFTCSDRMQKSLVKIQFSQWLQLEDKTNFVICLEEGKTGTKPALLCTGMLWKGVDYSNE